MLISCLCSCSTPRQRLALPLLHLRHSIASSGLSNSTRKASSVSEVLQLCAEDAEETLYELGFGCDEPEVTDRIPTRFLNFTSQLHGINFRLFLQSQLCRLRQEDPGLCLASRFKQVEMLTAMANAFYSLYSHVSRMPLQKLSPPEFSFTPTTDRQTGQRFMGSVRSKPRSPVERLKDTVSKMCLYTSSGGSTQLGLDSACHGPGFSSGLWSGLSPKKRSSLPDLVGLVLENAKAEAVSRDMEEDNQDTGDSNGMSAAVDTSTMVKDRETETQGHIDTVSDKEREQDLLSDVQDMDTGHSSVISSVETHLVKDRVTETQGHRDTVRGKGLDQGSSSDGDGADLERERHTDRTPNLRTSSLSESGQREPSSRNKLDFCLTTPSPTCEVGETHTTIHPTDWAAVVAPVAKVTHDVICPQIVESVHQAFYSSQLKQWNNNTQMATILSSVVSCENVRSDRSFTTSDTLHKPRKEKGLTTSNSAKSLEVVITLIPKAESEGDYSVGETETQVESKFVPIKLPSGKRSPCPITVTDVACSFSSADTPEMVLTPSGGTTEVPTAAQYYPWGNKWYQSPLKPPPIRVQGDASHSLQQANSFELEEVHSAGEEDFGQQETIRSTSLSLSTVNQNTGLVVRGDSMQSDSSGYADEDVNFSVYSPDRDKS
uniref:ITPR-interacting domain-containing protein n=1 Tax=Hucho hucho TaxID=62062 RepID=A0A4W5RME1_9TELE